MEKLSDILKTVKERLSSPLIFSFLLSWLAYNWEITVAAIWLNDEQIKHEGYNSLLELIRAKDPSYGLPILFAILYTGLSPVIKNFTSALQTWAIAWGQNWNLKLSKDSNIPMSKFLSLKDDYIKRTKILEEHLKDAKNSTENFEKQHTKLLEQQQRNSELAETINQITAKVNDEKTQGLTALYRAFEVGYLNGFWVCYKSSEDGIGIKEFLNIIDGRVFTVLNKKGDSKHTYQIGNFSHDVINGKVFFVKYESTSDLFLINELQEVEKTQLKGYENKTTAIIYRKTTDINSLMD